MAIKKYLIIVLLILTVGLLTAACDDGAGIGPSGEPAAERAVLEEPASGEEVEQTLNMDYLFEMSAEVNGLVEEMAYDQLKSEWRGEFSVDSDGLISGDGMLTFDAFVFAVNEDLCGYAWTELGQMVFMISGKVLKQGGEEYFPVKILPLQVERYSLSEPEATCSDPQGYLKDIPDIYIKIHRDALISTVLTHLHQNLGEQIQSWQVLEQESGTVNYHILVSPAVVPLD